MAVESERRKGASEERERGERERKAREKDERERERETRERERERVEEREREERTVVTQRPPESTDPVRRGGVRGTALRLVRRGVSGVGVRGLWP